MCTNPWGHLFRCATPHMDHNTEVSICLQMSLCPSPHYKLVIYSYQSLLAESSGFSLISRSGDWNKLRAVQYGAYADSQCASVQTLHSADLFEISLTATLNLPLIPLTIARSFGFFRLLLFATKIEERLQTVNKSHELEIEELRNHDQV